VSFSVVPAGEQITRGRFVAINSSGYAIYADPFSAERSRAVGVSANDAQEGERVRIVTSDYVYVQTNSTIGAPVYLSIEASGTVTTDFANRVALGYNEYYDPFYVTKVGNALTAVDTKIEIEDGMLTSSENSALLTEDQSPLIEYLVAEDGSKILLENA